MQPARRGQRPPHGSGRRAVIRLISVPTNLLIYLDFVQKVFCSGTSANFRQILIHRLSDRKWARAPVVRLAGTLPGESARSHDHVQRRVQVQAGGPHKNIFRSCLLETPGPVLGDRRRRVLPAPMPGDVAPRAEPDSIMLANMIEEPDQADRRRGGHGARRS